MKKLLCCLGLLLFMSPVATAQEVEELTCWEIINTEIDDTKIKAIKFNRCTGDTWQLVKRFGDSRTRYEWIKIPNENE